jgi:hypothetical protein
MLLASATDPQRSHLADEQLRELATDDLRLKYNAPAVLERLLAYAVRDIFLPHEAQQMSFVRSKSRQGLSRPPS